MWSPYFYYLNIYKDEDLSESRSTPALVGFLSSIPSVKATGQFSFIISKGDVSASLLLLKASSIDSWSDSETNKFETNLIAIVCHKKEMKLSDDIMNILIDIAKYLRWQLVDEQTDDYVENFTIWKP